MIIYLVLEFFVYFWLFVMGCLCSSKASLEGVWERGSLRVTVQEADTDTKISIDHKGMLFRVDYILTDSDDEYKWTVFRSLNDVLGLQHHLRGIQIPEGISFWSLMKISLIEKEPDFFKDHRQSHIDGISVKIAEGLTIYLQNVADNARNDKRFRIFSQVSALSFECGRSKPLLEGFVRKRRGGRTFIAKTWLGSPQEAFARLRRYSKRWLVLRDDHLLYAQDETADTALDVILFDSQLIDEEVLPSKKGFFSKCIWWIQGFRHALKIKNGYRSLVVKFNSRQELLRWRISIEQVIEKSGLKDPLKYDSAYPPRSESSAVLLVDGSEYFSAVLAAIQNATVDIFICGWWLSPQLLLDRGSEGDQSTRTLGEVLFDKAKAGVKIFVVLYHEVSVAMYNDAVYTCGQLEAGNGNIRAVCHPNRLGSNATYLWSHHSKLVVVDHEVAFVGGLDLCWGRFDDQAHDLGDVEGKKFPGREYVNFVRRDFIHEEVRNSEGECLLNRRQIARLPWHDVAVEVRGDFIVGDLSRHFVQIWNHVKTDRHKNAKKVQFLRFTGAAVKAKEKFQSWIDKIKSKKVVLSTPPDLIGRIDSNESEMFSIESSNNEIKDTGSEVSFTSSEEERPLVSRPSKSIINHVHTDSIDLSIEPTNCSIQLIRSVSRWSIGLPTETSILNAYVGLIRNASSYVYIENQFFISQVGCSSSDRYYCQIKNMFAKELSDRIKRAESENDPRFKVYLVHPAAPAFQLPSAAEFFMPEAYLSRSTMSLMASTMRALRFDLGDEVWSRRVSAHSLRKFETWHDGTVKCEQIYVHSKLLIVDDNVAVIGSANVNDRSLRGSRDSELCVVIESASFAKEARIKLWAEHLLGKSDCYLPPELIDPTGETCWSYWKETSARNSAVFRDLFGCWPDNSLRTKEQLLSLVERSPFLDQVKDQLDTVRGRLVDFALDFLCEIEDIVPPIPLYTFMTPKVTH